MEKKGYHKYINIIGAQNDALGEENYVMECINGIFG